MQTTIQKWGNSLAIRIPVSFVKEAALNEGSPIEISMGKGVIIIKAVKEKYKLADLLKKMNESNVHGESQTGEPIGNEIW